MAYTNPTKTWGFEVIRALDSNDVARALRAFKIPGSHVDAQLEDSYGFYKWPWMHRYYGDTAVHLAIEWKRENILRALLTLKPRLDIRNSKNELAADICLAKLGLPLEQIVAEEEARWKAEREAAEAERLRQEALERYRKRLQALHDKASVHCLAEAKELLMKGCVKGRVYFDPSSSKHKQAARFGAGPLESSTLSRLLVRLDGLTSLSTRDHLRYEVLDDDKARALAEALRHNRSITSLSLARSRFTATGLQSLLSALQPDNNQPTDDRMPLRHLDLSHTHLNDEGATVLSHFLSTTPHSLEALVLDHNRLSERGALALVQASLGCASMACLRLTHNEAIGDKGRRAIGNVLANAARRDPAYSRLKVLTLAPKNLPASTVHVVKRLSHPGWGGANAAGQPMEGPVEGPGAHQEAHQEAKSPVGVDPFCRRTPSLQDSPFSTPRNSDGERAVSPFLRPESRGEMGMQAGQGPRGGVAVMD